MRNIRKKIFLLLGVAVSCSAIAETDSPLLFGGARGSADNKYYYLGAIVPFEGSKVGSGTFHKTVINWIGYKYDAPIDGVNTTVDVQAPAIEWGVGYAKSSDQWSGEISLSGGVRRTNLSPFDPDSSISGTQFTLTPQVQALWKFSPSFDADGVASYSFGPDSSFVRTRLGWKPAESWRVGPEFSRVRGPDYNSRSAALFASKTFTSGLSVNVVAGRARDQDARRSTFLGLEFAMPL